MDLHERAGAAGGAAAEDLQRVLLVRGGGGDGHQPHDFARLKLVRHLRERHVEAAVHGDILRRQLVQRRVEDVGVVGPQLHVCCHPATHGAVVAVVEGVVGGEAVVRAVHSVKLHQQSTNGHECVGNNDH